jgi:hypothetical protein
VGVDPAALKFVWLTNIRSNKAAFPAEAPAHARTPPMRKINDSET